MLCSNTSFFFWSWNWSCFYSVLQKNMGIGCSFEFPPKEFRWPGVLCLNPNFPSGIIWNDASSFKTLTCVIKHKDNLE